MQLHRSIARRQLDLQLNGFRKHIEKDPANGWIWTIRRALGMTTGDLAQRMAITQARASRLERSETDGSLRLSTLRRAAEALDCQLVYVFVPDEPLEDMVRRQARHKAAEVIASEKAYVATEPKDVGARVPSDFQESLAIQLIDSPGLWRPRADPRPSADGRPSSSVASRRRPGDDMSEDQPYP